MTGSAVVAARPAQEVEIAVARLDVAEDALQALSALLSQAEHERAARFVFERDRDRFIVARARLRQLLAERLDTRPEAVDFVYGRYGKPALAPRWAASRLRFNVSHAGEVATYAFSNHEVGIDVEVVRPLPAAEQVAARTFSPREFAAYQALAAADRPLGFFNGWTRKEAFVKAIGKGLHYRLDRFDVSLTPGEPARLLRVDGCDGDACGWVLQAFLPAPGLVGAIVSKAGATA